MKNFTFKTLTLGMVLSMGTSLSAQTITYQRNEEISKQLRQSHRTVPLWGDFTKNGYMDVYYSGTSGANGWWNGVGGFLIENKGNGNLYMNADFNYEDYEETIWQRDEEGNIKTDEEGNWLPELNEDGTVKTETRTRTAGMKNGLPKSAWGHGSVAFDFDQNGYVDMLIANAGGNDTGTKQGYILVKNNGDGTYTVVDDEGLKGLGYNGEGQSQFNEGQEQLKVAVGDYDRDGYPDVLIEGWANERAVSARHISLLHNKKGEGFEEMFGIFKPVPYENEINVRDLYVDEYLTDEDGIDIGHEWHIDQPTNNIFRASHGPVNFADIDGDGYLDIFVSGWRDGADDAPEGKNIGGWDFRFYKNLQDGTFQDVTDQMMLSGAVAGIDEVRSYGGNLMIYPLDFNQDGKIDLYFNGDTNSKGKVAMYWQNTTEEGGAFSFEPINIDGQSGVGDPTHRLFFVADLNGDDYPDFYVDGWSAALGDWGRTWQVSDASGSYTTEAYYQGEVRPCPNGAWLSDGNIESGSFGDFDGDGKIDILVAGWEDAPWAGEGGEGSTYGYYDNLYLSLNTSDVVISTPDAPASVTASIDDDNNITVNWDPVYTSNGNQPMYNLYLKNKETGKTFVVAPANTETGKQEAYISFSNYVLGNTFTFPHVEEGTYEVGVQAVNYAYQGSAFTATNEDEKIITGIQSVATGVAKTGSMQVFTTDGRLTTGRGHGIFVVKEADGTVRKIVK